MPNFAWREKILYEKHWMHCFLISYSRVCKVMNLKKIKLALNNVSTSRYITVINMTNVVKKYTFLTLVQILLFLPFTWKLQKNFSFIQVGHYHRKLILLFFNSSSSASSSPQHFLWTTKLQFLQNTPVSALFFLLSQRPETTEIFCEL